MSFLDVLLMEDVDDLVFLSDSWTWSDRCKVSAKKSRTTPMGVGFSFFAEKAKKWKNTVEISGLIWYFRNR